MTKHKIGFIVHAGSGNKKKQQAKAEFEAYIRKDTGYDFFKLDNAEDILEATAEMAKKNYEAVYACGGDGTLNLVSGGLLHTETAMGIIPLGSGNGYARHHGLPLHWAKALKTMDNHQVSQRDTGLINGMHFLNIAGIGYSAKISKEFKNSRGRGLRGYLKSIGKNLKTGAFHAAIINKHAQWAGESLMVDFANGSQWGNNVKIAPNTRDDDGTLTAVIFKKTSVMKLPIIGFRLVTNTADNISDIYRIKGAAFILQIEGEQPMHIDGDYIGLAKEKVEVEVNNKSLKLWLFNS